MAVEIKRHHSKRLYRHATPIFLAAVAFIAVSAVTLSHYDGMKEVDQAQLGRAGVQSILKVKHTKNGLAKLSINDPQVEQPEKPKLDKANIGAAGNAVNQSMSLQLNFNK